MRLLSSLFSLLLLAIGVGAIVAMGVYSHYSENLPAYDYLRDYQPPTLSRIYADDGRMMAVVASEQRLFTPIDAIPRQVVDAFLSAEDSDFFHHNGIDYFGVARAAVVNLQNVGRGRHPMGASTITQQVAKNMLLTNEISISRKIREAILAMRLEKNLTKRRILEIYDQMTHCLATNTEYRSTLNPPPGPPCDENGNFIPVEQWDHTNWPKQIHMRNMEYK